MTNTWGVIEVVPGLDLRRGQSHRYATMNAMEGNLLGVRQDVLQMVDEQRAQRVDGSRSCVRCQLEVFLLYHQG